MGSPEGVLRTAAARVGLGVNEYVDRLNKGLRYATGKRVGKGKAGRVLDGRTHDGYPEGRAT